MKRNFFSKIFCENLNNVFYKNYFFYFKKKKLKIILKRIKFSHFIGKLCSAEY